MKGFIYLIEIAVAAILMTVALSAFFSISTKQDWTRPDLLVAGNDVLNSIRYDSNFPFNILSENLSTLDISRSPNIEYGLKIIGSPKSKLTIGCYIGCDYLSSILNPPTNEPYGSVFVNNRWINFTINYFNISSGIPSEDDVIVLINYTNYSNPVIENSLNNYLNSGGAVIGINRYLTKVPVDVVLIIDMSSSMMGDGSSWGENCRYACTGGCNVNGCKSGDPLYPSCVCPNVSDCDNNGNWADPWEISPALPCALNDAKNSAKSFTTFLNSSNDNISVVAFNETARLYQGLTNNYNAVNSSIDTITSTFMANTSIGYGIGNATKEFQDHGRSYAKKVEILLTDGIDYPINTHPADRAIEANASGITIYTIGLGKGINENLLKNISSITGGKYYYAPDSTSLEGIYEEISGSAGLADPNFLDFYNLNSGSGSSQTVNFTFYDPSRDDIAKYFLGIGMDAYDYWYIWGGKWKIDYWGSNEINITNVSNPSMTRKNLAEGDDFSLTGPDGNTYFFKVKKTWSDRVDLQILNKTFVFKDFSENNLKGNNIVGGPNFAALTANNSAVWMSDFPQSDEYRTLLKAAILSRVETWTAKGVYTSKETATLSSFTSLCCDMPETLELYLTVWYAI